MRALSLIIAIGYLLLSLLASASVKGAVGTALLVSVFLVLPLACIWFSEEIGDYVGMLPGPGISKRTPAALVKVGGWVLLLLPVVAYWLTRP